MRIGFITLTDAELPAPSTRVAVLNMLPYLQAAGHQTSFLFSAGGRTLTPTLPPTLADEAVARELDVVVFQKVHGAPAATLARELERRDVRCVYLVCDIVSPEMADATSATVVVTEFLRALYPVGLRHKVHVVHDGIERPELQVEPRDASADDPRRPVHAVLVTAQGLDHVPVLGNRLPEWLRITIVGRYPPEHQRGDRWRVARWALQRQPDMGHRLEYLRFAASSRIRRVAWGPDSVYQQLRSADVGIIPVVTDDIADPNAGGVPNWQVRSENRLTLKMAMGLPVVATPIPAYEPVIEQGVNGFLARDREDWWPLLAQLRDSGLRRRMGAAARQSVVARFSMASQAAALISVLAGCGRPCDRMRQLID